MLQLTQAETLLAGLLAAVLVLLAWLLVRSYTGARKLTAQLGDGATLRDAAHALGITERQAAYALRQARRQKR